MASLFVVGSISSFSLTGPNHHATTCQSQWVWVKIKYQNNWMVNARNRLKSVVPQVLHFDPIINMDNVK